MGIERPLACLLVPGERIEPSMRPVPACTRLPWCRTNTAFAPSQGLTSPRAAGKNPRLSWRRSLLRFHSSPPPGHVNGDGASTFSGAGYSFPVSFAPEGS